MSSIEKMPVAAGCTVNAGWHDKENRGLGARAASGLPLPRTATQEINFVDNSGE
jgi:hypothetical protein